MLGDISGEPIKYASPIQPIIVGKANEISSKVRGQVSSNTGNEFSSTEGLVDRGVLQEEHDVEERVQKECQLFDFLLLKSEQRKYFESIHAPEKPLK